MIDLSTIIYRAHQIGDSDTNKQIPDVHPNPTDSAIILSAIKFRSKQVGDED